MFALEFLQDERDTMRKALIVGIDNYPGCSLNGCVNDANGLSPLISRNSDDEPNFDTMLKTDISEKRALKESIVDLFSGDCDTALFYFAGHGCLNEIGGYIVTPDVKKYDEGVSMHEILTVANNSECRNRIIILDCCHSGAMGAVPSAEKFNAFLNEGLTILTACRTDESAREFHGHGIFTNLLIAALQGGAANLSGNITPGSIYSYIDQALGPWDQRPVFKTNVTQFISIRKVKPLIPVEILRKIRDYFQKPKDIFPLNPSFEDTNSPDIEHKCIEPFAIPENIVIFKNLQKMTSVGLIRPVGEEHMYFAAMNSRSCELTPLGQHYWRLVDKKRI